MTKIFNELNDTINRAIKRGDSPGDLITALTSCVLGVINCLKVEPEIKKELAQYAIGIIKDGE